MSYGLPHQTLLAIAATLATTVYDGVVWQACAAGAFVIGSAVIFTKREGAFSTTRSPLEGRDEVQRSDTLSIVSDGKTVKLVTEENPDTPILLTMLEPMTTKACERLTIMHERMQQTGDDTEQDSQFRAVKDVIVRADTYGIYRDYPADNTQTQMGASRRWKYGTGTGETGHKIPNDDQLRLHFIAGIAMQLFPWGTPECKAYIAHLKTNEPDPVYNNVIQSVTRPVVRSSSISEGAKNVHLIDPSNPLSWSQLSRYTKLRLLLRTRVDLPINEMFRYTIKVADETVPNSEQVAGEALREDEPTKVLVMDDWSANGNGDDIYEAGRQVINERYLYTNYSRIRTAIMDPSGGAWYSLSNGERSALRVLWKVEPPDPVDMPVALYHVESAHNFRTPGRIVAGQKAVARLRNISNGSEAWNEITRSTIYTSDVGAVGWGAGAVGWGADINSLQDVSFPEGITPRQLAGLYEENRIGAVPLKVQDALRKFAGVNVRDDNTGTTGTDIVNRLIVMELRQPSTADRYQPRAVLVASDQGLATSRSIINSIKQQVPGADSLGNDRFVELAKEAWPLTDKNKEYKISMSDIIDYAGPLDPDDAEQKKMVLLASRSGVVTERVDSKITVEFILVIGVRGAQDTSHLARITVKYDLDRKIEGKPLREYLRIASNSTSRDSNDYFSDMFEPVLNLERRAGLTFNWVENVPATIFAEDEELNKLNYITTYARKIFDKLKKDSLDFTLEFAPLKDVRPGARTASGCTIDENSTSIATDKTIAINRVWKDLSTLRGMLGSGGASEKVQWFTGIKADPNDLKPITWDKIALGIGTLVVAGTLTAGLPAYVGAGATGVATAAGLSAEAAATTSLISQSAAGLVGMTGMARAAWSKIKELIDTADGQERVFVIQQLGTTDPIIPLETGDPTADGPAA